MAVSLPPWLEELRSTEIVQRVRNDPRSTGGTVLGIAREAAMEAAGWGQADFDSTRGSLTAEDRVLLYAHFFQKGHLEELYEAFRQIFADTRPDNPIVVDLGCGPFTGGLALAGALNGESAFDYIGVDRSQTMCRLGERLAAAVAEFDESPQSTRQWAAGIASVSWESAPSWRPVIVIASYLLASPTLDAEQLIVELDDLLAKLGRGPVTVLYTNSTRPDANRSFPAFRAVLENKGFELYADDTGKIEIARLFSTRLRKYATLCFIVSVKTPCVWETEMQLPTWDELSEEQLDVLEHHLDRPLFVAGPPGSGKTTLALMRARMVAKDRGIKVRIITYNRMLRRLLTIMNDQDVDGIGECTMHSCIWRDYKHRTGKAPTRHPDDSYAFRWDLMLERLDEEGSQPYNRLHLIVDEGQDLPVGFFRYAADYIAPKMTVFADEDQALSNQQTMLEQIKKAARMDDPILLRKNHRNTPEVARVAEHFHSGRLPPAEVQRPAGGEAPVLLRSRNLETTAERISNWCSNRGGSIGAIFNSNDYGKRLQRKLTELLPKHRVNFYQNVKKNEDEIDVLLPGVTILNKESVKGQEFDTVFLLELERFIPCINDAERRAMYMMCSRARDNLFLVYGPNDLSPKADTALPGQNILERR